MMADRSNLTATMSDHVDDASKEAAAAKVEASGDEAPKSARTRKFGEADEPDTSVPEPGALLPRLAERAARRLGYHHLIKLAQKRGSVTRAFEGVPGRMHLVANQTELLLELIDDFRTGVYREVPWRSVFVASAAVLYTVSPADVIPDWLLGIGFVDDLAVVAVATRLIRKDLKAYCRFKGYSVDKYFGHDDETTPQPQLG